MIPFPLDGIYGAHIEVPDWCTEQGGIELLDVVCIGAHPILRWKSFTKWGGRFADMNVLQTRFGLRHSVGVPEIAWPLLAGQP